jgi:hypothetical protein
MDSTMVLTALAPVLAGLISMAGAYLRERLRRRRLSRDLLALPPGSRVIDLGEHGLVMEIGGHSSTVLPAGDE